MAENLKKLIQGQIDCMNDTLDVIRTIPDVFSIDTAIGKHLDSINNFVDGTYRPYIDNDSTKPVYSDSELRERIKFKMDMNNISGTIQSIVMATQYFLILDNQNSINTVKDSPIGIKYESGYVTVEIYAGVTSSGFPADKINEIYNFIPVGIGYYFIEIWEGNTFTLDDTFDAFGNGTIDIKLGCSDINDDFIGGKLAEIQSYK